MLRVEDDLYQRVFNAAHDERLSMNAFITRILDEKAEQ